MPPPVIAASPMNDATSMWSGPMRHSPPRSDSTPLDAQHVRLDALDLGAERDEEAAEVLHVRLARRVADHGLARASSTAAMTVFSVAMTLASSRKTCVAAQAVARAHLEAVADARSRRRARRTRGCAGRAGAGRSRRRRAAARSRAPTRDEQRAREQERRAHPAAELLVELALVDVRGAARAPRCVPVHSTSAPTSASSATIVSTSRMRGTFVSVTGSSVSRHAARIGSAPFLFPAARIVPDSGRRLRSRRTPSTRRRLRSSP